MHFLDINHQLTFGIINLLLLSMFSFHCNNSSISNDFKYTCSKNEELCFHIKLPNTFTQTKYNVSPEVLYVVKESPTKDEIIKLLVRNTTNSNYTYDFGPNKEFFITETYEDAKLRIKASRENERVYFIDTVKIQPEFSYKVTHLKKKMMGNYITAEFQKDSLVIILKYFKRQTENPEEMKKEFDKIFHSLRVYRKGGI